VLCKDFSEIWYSKADAELAMGKTSDALKSYERVIKLESKNYDAWFDYGCALLDSKNYPAALEAFDNALKFNPKWAEPYYEKSKIHFLSGNYGLGIEMLETAFNLNPSDRFEYDVNTGLEKVMTFLMKR
jgi:tetratricopeptide (TPR) repeat protein